MKTLFLIAFLAVAIATGRATDDPITMVPTNDAGMNAAMAHARATVDSFLKILQAGSADRYAVKVPIKDKGQTEYFWLSDVTYTGGKFTGTIDNAPDLVTNVKLGQIYTVDKSGIADWLYMKDGKMHGNFTIRVLLPTMSKDDAERIREMLAPE